MYTPYLAASPALQHPGLLPQATPIVATQLGAAHYGATGQTGHRGAEKRGRGLGERSWAL